MNTLPEQAIADFSDHGRVARSLDAGVEEAAEVMRRLAAVGVAGCHVSFDQLLASFAAKAHQLTSR